jgi:hypothetical protein
MGGEVVLLNMNLRILGLDPRITLRLICNINPLSHPVIKILVGEMGSNA